MRIGVVEDDFVVAAAAHEGEFLTLEPNRVVGGVFHDGDCAALNDCAAFHVDPIIILGKFGIVIFVTVQTAELERFAVFGRQRVDAVFKGLRWRESLQVECKIRPRYENFVPHC